MIWTIPPFAAVSKTRRALGKDAIFILGELRQGIAAAFETKQGVSIIRNEFPELVIVAYEGQDGIGAFEFWREVARMKGYKTIRFHSSRPGMIKYARKHSIPAEIVFRSQTDGRQK